MAIVYESIALHRRSQAQTTQGQPDRIYYPNNTIETVATAAVTKNSDKNIAKTANQSLPILKILPRFSVCGVVFVNVGIFFMVITVHFERKLSDNYDMNLKLI